ETLRAIVPWTQSLYETHRAEDSRLVSPEAFNAAPADEAAIEASLGQIDPNSVAIFVYTSGTTGPPKAAMISHQNILALCRSEEKAYDYYTDDLYVSFLPMAHAAERNLGFYGRISTGLATAYASSIGALLTELGEVRPTLFGSVPRIF